MELEFSPLKLQMKNLKFDINSIIDDFVFLFYFIGNDFLPRMYCFDIRNENLEKLLKVF
jgi:5'-3' exoribonuclease 1